MKNSSDTIGNRTRDLPVCSAVPQSTAPSRNPPQLTCYEQENLRRKAHFEAFPKAIMFFASILVIIRLTETLQVGLTGRYTRSRNPSLSAYCVSLARACAVEGM